ncbi:putative cytosol aminopeptidase [Longispora fulva]|uniref:Probable cytosol aminopeptidase n=1 Tax=Longispora fulva TaxID=619741 RepID=A0A8J7GK08_9ACTN|nr:leucyl aminopeptidase [Longispora fulva]MBG6138232.1 leucyl aminopeptidase [Longispora fulva]GIG60484.1 putative cytosol aminopeptidase [Longispora fulva]
MTTLALADTDPAELPVDAIVVGVYSDADPAAAPLLAQGAEGVDAAFDGKLAATLALLGATGAVGEVTKLASLGATTAPVVAAVGLGTAGPAPAETLRRAAGSAVRALTGTAKVALALPGLSGEDGGLRAVAEGALLGAYRFAGYKSKPAPKAPVSTVTVLVTDAADKEAKAEIKRAAVIADAVTLCRDFVNTAPNELRPPSFADLASAAAKKAGLEVEVLDEKALRKGGYGGILAVGDGSEAKPRLVRITYKHKSAKKKVALVGKGITFDTGGVSIKPAAGMWEMKSDMGGAAAVIAAMIAIAALKPKVDVVAYAPMAENMPSGTAYRPGDIVTMYGGTKVEVLNTDAEGRMILGDAIARACEDEPNYLLETSTLTGGQVVSLGKRVHGLMGDAELCARVQAAGDRVGEQGWTMPLPDDIKKNMESDIADILQVSAGMDRGGHMLQGGIFLSAFVTEGVEFAHIDVAGPSYHSGEPYGYIAKGGTGVPVRTLIEAVEDIARNG